MGRLARNLERRGKERVPYDFDVLCTAAHCVPDGFSNAWLAFHRKPRLLTTNLAENRDGTCSWDQTLHVTLTLFRDQVSQRFEEKEFDVLLEGMPRGARKVVHIARGSIDFGAVASDPASVSPEEAIDLDLDVDAKAAAGALEAAVVPVRVVVRAQPTVTTASVRQGSAELKRVAKLVRAAGAAIGKSDPRPKITNKVSFKQANKQSGAAQQPVPWPPGGAGASLVYGDDPATVQSGGARRGAGVDGAGGDGGANPGVARRSVGRVGDERLASMPRNPKQERTEDELGLNRISAQQYDAVQVQSYQDGAPGRRGL
ncbi:unnamed protein product [Pedinophyceae sp. YPF-701]|nr:unnamed protein product [Pedinophyceae sp. YPF-701]